MDGFIGFLQNPKWWIHNPPNKQICPKKVTYRTWKGNKTWKRGGWTWNHHFSRINFTSTFSRNPGEQAYIEKKHKDPSFMKPTVFSLRIYGYVAPWPPCWHDKRSRPGQDPVVRLWWKLRKKLGGGHSDCRYPLRLCWCLAFYEVFVDFFFAFWVVKLRCFFPIRGKHQQLWKAGRTISHEILLLAIDMYPTEI